jgi:hypothetical protein
MLVARAIALSMVVARPIGPCEAVTGGFYPKLKRSLVTPNQKTTGNDLVDDMGAFTIGESNHLAVKLCLTVGLLVKVSRMTPM